MKKGKASASLFMLVFFFFVCETLSLSGCNKSTESATTGTLKDLAAARSIRFGAMYQYDLRGDLYDQVFETEMNVLTAGTFMLDGGVSHKSRYEFDFSEMDTKVNWGRARDVELHGHILV